MVNVVGKLSGRRLRFDLLPECVGATLNKIKRVVAAQVSVSGAERVPTVSLVSALTSTDETKLAFDSWSAQRTAVAGCTIRLGAGISFDDPDMFHTAYLFLDMSLHSADLADMIQLSARVRSIVSRTLRYAIKTSIWGNNPRVEANACGQLKNVLKKVDSCLAPIQRYHQLRFITRGKVTASVMFARIETRSLLLAAYSRRTDEPTYAADGDDTEAEGGGAQVRAIRRHAEKLGAGYQVPTYKRYRDATLHSSLVKADSNNRHVLTALRDTSLVVNQGRPGVKRAATGGGVDDKMAVRDLAAAEIPQAKRVCYESRCAPFGRIVPVVDAQNEPVGTVTLIPNFPLAARDVPVAADFSGWDGDEAMVEADPILAEMEDGAVDTTGGVDTLEEDNGDDADYGAGSGEEDDDEMPVD